ncbi:hypothetical protein PG994_005488 [Apiospora phragmitis]|uniref:Uncharacterized protein n=1 Tax=Apiospora phragmitis TaxID=2905665 RepID=A0ABR1VDD7_9PEZI
MPRLQLLDDSELLQEAEPSVPFTYVMMFGSGDDEELSTSLCSGRNSASHEHTSRQQQRPFTYQIWTKISRWYIFSSDHSSPADVEKEWVRVAVRLENGVHSIPHPQPSSGW